MLLNSHPPFSSLSCRCRLFEEHAELINLFEKFKELRTKEEQSTSEELAEHANKVMETLDEGIRSLDELDVFFQYLHEVGASHRRIPGFTSDHFWVSKTILNSHLRNEYVEHQQLADVTVDNVFVLKSSAIMRLRWMTVAL